MSFYDLKANKIDGTEVSCKTFIKCTVEPTFIAYLVHLKIEYLSQFCNPIRSYNILYIVRLIIHFSRFRDFNIYVNL